MTGPHPLQAVVWDMGGILYETPFEALVDVEGRRGLPPGTYPRGPFDPEDDYRLVETGELTEPEYWRAQHVRLRSAGVDLDVYTAVSWEDRHRPEVWAVVRQLAGRVQQAVLTNDASDWLGEGWWDRWPLRDVFDAVVDVAVLGVRKPDPRAYRAAADQLNVACEACLFVDDLPANLDGARAVGMQAVHFDVRDIAGSLARIRQQVDACPSRHPGGFLTG